MNKQTNPSNAATMAPDLMLDVASLNTAFVFKEFRVNAVRDVSFTLQSGKTLALVGESGSGKSVTALSMIGLLAAAGKITNGHVLYRGSNGEVNDLAQLNSKALRKFRGPEIAMIFQEPMTSLNPLFTVGDQISEMVLAHEPVSRAQARKRALHMLELVEIPSAAQRLDDYPHQMSGGMRQRVMIALALVCNPALLIADEPTTALDVTIQAQILDLMRRLQAELGMSILFITHDMGVVAEIADQVAVMYAGEVVEQAEVTRLFKSPSHPYTQGLLASIPNSTRDRDAQGNRNRLVPIPGTVPPIHDLPEGCAFSPRCAHAEDKCRAPALLQNLGANHMCRCWKSEQI